MTRELIGLDRRGQDAMKPAVTSLRDVNDSVVISSHHSSGTAHDCRVGRPFRQITDATM